MDVAEENSKENNEKSNNSSEIKNNNNGKDYDSDKIKVLEGLEGVRLRPSMYIGDISITGLHHLAYEIIDNSVDEAMAGYCNTIKVEFHPGNRIIIEDNGRGIPTKIHPIKKIPTLELILTSLHSGGKFDKNSYKVSGGLHGVGLAVVNACSEIMKVTVWRDGKQYYQEFGKGMKRSEISEITLTDNLDKTGTKVEFIPDKEIFRSLDFTKEVFERERIESRLQNMSFLNPGLRIIIYDYRPPTSLNKTKNETDEWITDETKEKQDSFSSMLRVESNSQNFVYSKEFYSENGLIDFIQYLNIGKTPLEPQKIIYFTNKEKIEKIKDDVNKKQQNSGEEGKTPTEISIALQYCDNSYQENLFSFVNNIATEHG